MKVDITNLKPEKVREIVERFKNRKMRIFVRGKRIILEVK